MPILPTPRQLGLRANFYHQLASLLSAGIGLIGALEMAERDRAARSLRRPLSRILEQLKQGATLSDALQTATPGWWPPFDVALVEAGETSGRLDVCFRHLSSYYEERARLAREVLSGLAYPLFIVHFAILIFPVTLLSRLVWQGDVLGFAAAKLAVLVPAYTVVLALLWLGCAGRRGAWRAWLERIWRRVPFLGQAFAHLCLARLSVALESLLNAGVPIVEAWELAAAASGSPRLQRAVNGWRDEVTQGQTPAEAVRESGAFPDLFANLYATGELSGQLDGTLQRLYHHYQEEAIRQWRAIAQWTPRLVYLGVVFVIAWQILSFWSGYFSQISELTK